MKSDDKKMMYACAFLAMFLLLMYGWGQYDMKREVQKLEVLAEQIRAEYKDKPVANWSGCREIEEGETLFDYRGSVSYLIKNGTTHICNDGEWG